MHLVLEGRAQARPLFLRPSSAAWAEPHPALPAGPNVLRLLPPLTIEEHDLDRVAEAVEGVLG